MEANTRYVLGTSDAELARLRRQNEALSVETRWLFDRLDLKPGASAVDVGCGPLGVLELLSQRVGSTGRVVGVDINEVMLRSARQLLDASGHERVELVHANASSTGLERASFDLVHERLVLINIPQPEVIVREMAALAKPGGVVALAEIDGVSWCCDPPHPAWEKLYGAFCEVFRRRGCDPNIGRRTARLLRDAGLVDVRVEFHARSHGSEHVWRNLLLQFTEITRAEAVASGLLDASEVDGLKAALAAHLSDPDTTLLSPIVAHAWGRKPLAS
ncbi:MAG: methyltransferase domain-containing protein [Polyangiales bacterium]